MGSNKNIFDLSDISDLSDTMKSSLLRKKNYNRYYIVELFKMKLTLNLDEVSVGLFRKFKIQKNRNNLTTILSKMVKDGILKKSGKGVWELKI